MQYRQTRTRGVEMMVISGLEPSRRIEIAGTLGPFKARLTSSLEPIGLGSRLTNQVELEASLPLGLFGDVLGGRRIRASVAESLGVLKTLLEGGVRPSRR